MNIAAWLWQGGTMFALGGSAFLRRAGPPPGNLQDWHRRVRIALCAAAVVAFVCGFVALHGEGARIAGRALAIDAPEWRVLLERTRFGRVWLVKQALLVLLIAACALVAWRAAARGVAPIVLGAAFLAAGTWAGHGGATPPVAINVTLHALHAIAAGLWFGGLPVWVWLVRTAGDDDAERAFLGRAIARFSTLATALMAMLFASGTWIAVQQFERWPAVFGTPAGYLLLAKLGALAVALSQALRLRQRYLVALGAPHAPALRSAALRSVFVEALAAGLVLVFAIELARSTPGAHLDIVWPWPFRFAPVAAWADPIARWQMVAGATLALIALPALAWRHRRIAGGCLAAGVLLALYGLAIAAWPDTYRQPGVTYTARWIHQGAQLFEANCISCHGAGARGDGRPPAPGVAPAADLAEHTALHTAGDMFWWISHGTPSGNMPGFHDTLDEEQRWALINFLRAFADGHRGRVLSPNVMPKQPWLGAPDFQFESADGDSGRLQDHRELHPVLVVLARLPGSRARLAALAADSARWRRLDLRLLTLVEGGRCSDLGAAAASLGCVTRGGEDAGFAWRLLARTLAEPGSRHALLPDVAHAEFLIDRFGFLRARWIPAQEMPGWNDATALEREVAKLAQEPKILESPDEHVH